MDSKMSVHCVQWDAESSLETRPSTKLQTTLRPEINDSTPERYHHWSDTQKRRVI